MEERKRAYVLNKEADLKSALLAIETNNHRCIIAVNDDDRVVGTLSDGDVRKHLLRNHLLVGKIKDLMNTNFRFLTKVDPERARFLFSTLHITLIPVLDEQGILVDIIEAY